MSQIFFDKIPFFGDFKNGQKSNKSMSQIFFDQIPFFCDLINGQKTIFELGKSLKMPKMQFHEKKFFLFI